MYDAFRRLAFADEIRQRDRAAKKREYQRSKQKLRNRHEQWKKRNQDYVRKYESKRIKKQRKSDLNFQIRCVLRTRLLRTLKGKTKSKPAIELLGCSIEDFKIYIESKFEPGMSWENYGHQTWNIDHIIPCALFDLTKPEHQKRCFHFSNMQPMWSRENNKKGHRATSDQFPLI